MYGETGPSMRSELAALLRQHRVQQTLSDSPDTAERERNSSLIRRYRQSVLTWCVQSAHTARPLAFTNLPKRPTNPFSPGSADEPAVTELIRSLEATTSGSTATLPSLEELTTPHPIAVVEHWRQAARAAALAEHDTGPDFHGRLTTAQAQALLGDVAAVTQALVVLDQRYRLTPGWEPLAGSQRLAWTALACAIDVGLGQPDYSLDQNGWRPRIKPIRGPVKPGLLGVLQAEHNLLIRLRPFPNVTNLRRIVDSQRLLSQRLSPLAAPAAPDAAERWTARSQTYGDIQRQLRNLGGHLGKGGHAAAEGANAVSRLQHVAPDTVIPPRVLAGFQTLFDTIDDRIADVIEEGVRRAAFVQRVAVPRVVAESHKMVQPVRERFVVVADPAEIEVIATVREQLRPAATQSLRQRPDASRAELHAALVHRPSRRCPTATPHL